LKIFSILEVGDQYHLLPYGSQQVFHKFSVTMNCFFLYFFNDGSKGKKYYKTIPYKKILLYCTAIHHMSRCSTMHWCLWVVFIIIIRVVNSESPLQSPHLTSRQPNIILHVKAFLCMVQLSLRRPSPFPALTFWRILSDLTSFTC